MKKKENKNLLKRIVDVGKVLFWKNKVTAGLIYTSLLLNLLIWVGLIFLTKGEQSVLIGHYNVFFGIDVLVDLSSGENMWELFLPPLGGSFFLMSSIAMSVFLILQLDITKAKEVNVKEAFISNKSLSFMGSRLLLIGSWLLQLIIVIYFMMIWKIN